MFLTTAHIRPYFTEHAECHRIQRTDTHPQVLSRSRVSLLVLQSRTVKRRGSRDGILYSFNTVYGLLYDVYNYICPGICIYTHVDDIANTQVAPIYQNSKKEKESNEPVQSSQKTLDHTPLHLFFPSDSFKASTRARVADSCRTHVASERLAPCPCVAPSSCVLAGPKAASSSRKVYQRRHQKLLVCLQGL